MKNSSEQSQQIAYVILRATLGLAFLTFGASKIFIIGTENFAGYMMGEFSGLLPEFMLIPFVWSLPFIELTLGILVLLGLFSLISLATTGTLIAVLTFGAVLSGDPATVAHNMIYAIIIFFLLWNINANHWSLDTKVRS